MKNSVKLLIALAIAFAGMQTASAQVAQSKHQVFKRAKEAAENRPYYDSLLRAFIVGRELPVEQMSDLYYGFVYTRGYRKDGLYGHDRIRRLRKEGKYKKAYDLGKEVLHRNPFNIMALYEMTLLTESHKLLSERPRYDARLANMIKTVQEIEMDENDDFKSMTLTVINFSDADFMMRTTDGDEISHPRPVSFSIVLFKGYPGDDGQGYN